VTGKRHLAFVAISMFLGIAAALALIEVALRYQAAAVQSQDRMDPGLFVFDPSLGWRMAANWRGEHRHHDFHVRYSTNDYGLRGPWPEAEPAAFPRKARVAFLGDSFTFGLGVNDDETFVQRLNETGDTTSYLNAGIAGYSTDQEYLYLKHRLPTWRLDRLELVVYLANDLIDNTLAFPLQAEMGKPLFVLEGEQLRLTNVPVRQEPKPPEERARTLSTVLLGDEAARAGSPHWWSRTELWRRLGLAEPAAPERLSELHRRMEYPLTLFLRIIHEIRRVCEQNGVALTVVLMPGRSYVEDPLSYSAAFQDDVRRSLVEAHLGVPVVDLAARLREHFEQTGEHLYHAHEGHLNAAGHRRVALWLGETLARSVPRE